MYSSTKVQDKMMKHVFSITFIQISSELELIDNIFSALLLVARTNLSHPFHLHGYSYFVMGMGRSPDKNIKKINMRHVQDLDQKTLLERNFVQPPAKDTVAVPNNGYLIFRFRADNPGNHFRDWSTQTHNQFTDFLQIILYSLSGYWLLHCHFVYHAVIGMEIVLHVGNTTDVPPIPRDFPVCGNYLPPITPNENQGPIWTWITCEEKLDKTIMFIWCINWGWLYDLLNILRNYRQSFLIPGFELNDFAEESMVILSIWLRK